MPPDDSVLNPFLITTQWQPEDRVTYAFSAMLQAGGARALGSLLEHLGLRVPEGSGQLRVNLQLAGPGARPDARFEAVGVVVLFENKIRQGTLDEGQLRRHLGLLGAAPNEHFRVLLAITPDDAAPTWWSDFSSTCDGGVRAVYGSWTQVYAWTKKIFDAGQNDERGSWFARWFAGLLEHERLVMTASTTFDAETLAAVTDGADRWRVHLDRQHAAQEAFLAQVADNFWKKIEERRGETRRDHQVYSRWKERPDFPVSSVLEFWWPVAGLVGWPTLHVWAEVFLSTEAEDRGLKMRSGILLGGFGLGVRESQKLVASWFGRAQTVAKATFTDRYYPWHEDASYGEVWAQSPFDLEKLGPLAEQLVRDLLDWVETVPAKLRLLGT